MKSALWSIGKYILAVVLLIFILRHAQADKIMGYLRQIPPMKILLGLTLITLAQIVSGLRMRFFFQASGFEIHKKFAIVLFYVGAFYNFLLPGGIGGDAYKVILARKRMNISAPQGIRIMLADRASGLFVIMITMLATLAMLDFSIPFANVLFGACAIVTLAGYLFFSNWLVKLGPKPMLASLRYTVVIQGLWAAALLNVWASLGNGKYAVEYIVLYCASGITGTLPVSVGGLGIKEMTYYYGAEQLRHYAHSGVDGDLGIAISLCLFFLVFVCSLPGLLWLNKVEKLEHS